MRNLKRALSLTLASVMLLGMMVIGTSAASYPDVDKDNNVEAIEVLQAVGVMQGDDKGNFDPDRTVSRNEMAIVMAKLLNLDYNYYSESCPFWDVPDYAKPYVGACFANGIVSGYSATQYGGADTVTAVQAASMMMRALGYFQYDSDYKEGFVIATVKQASKIGLFKDINANQDSPLTRDQVAQLALNTLETGMVDARKSSADISIGSGDTAVTISGAVEYVYVTSGDNSINTAIDNVEATSIGTQNDKMILELGEKLYNGDLKKYGEKTNGSADEFDSFGRPSVTWTYKNDKVGTYAKEADLIATYTKKVSKGDIYGLLSSAVRSDLEKTTGGSTLTVTVDGQEIKNGNTNADASSWYVRNSSDAVYTFPNVTGSSRNGTLTEVYLDKDNNVDIVIINTYVYQATSDYSSSRDDVKMAPAGDTTLALKAGELTLKGEDFNIQDVKTDDYLLITAASETGTAYEVQSVKVAEKVTGEVTGYADKDSVTIDGTTYNYSATCNKDGSYVRDTTYTVGQDAIVVVDEYGYVIAVDEAVSSNSFVFIKKTGGTSGLNSKAVGDAYFTDGSNEEITIDRIDTVKSANTIATGTDAYGNKWYTYSVNSDGKYVLYSLGSGRSNANKPYTASGREQIVINGRVDFLKDSSAIANDKTIMLVKDKDGDVTAYTGTTNIPDIFLPDTKTATVYYSINSKNYTEYAFVDLEGTNASVVDGGDDTSFLYVLRFKDEMYGSSATRYFNYSTIDPETGAEEKIPFDSNYFSGSHPYQLRYKPRYNSDDRITSLTEVPDEWGISTGKYFNRTIGGTGIVTYKDGALRIGDVNFIVAGDSKITLVIVKNGSTASLLADKGADHEFYFETQPQTVDSLLKDYRVTGTIAGATKSSTSSVIDTLYITVTEIRDASTSVDSDEILEDLENAPAGTPVKKEDVTLDKDVNVPENKALSLGGDVDGGSKTISGSGTVELKGADVKGDLTITAETTLSGAVSVVAGKTLTLADATVAGTLTAAGDVVADDLTVKGPLTLGAEATLTVNEDLTKNGGSITAEPGAHITVGAKATATGLLAAVAPAKFYDKSGNEIATADGLKDKTFVWKKAGWNLPTSPLSRANEEPKAAGWVQEGFDPDAEAVAKAKELKIAVVDTAQGINDLMGDWGITGESATFGYWTGSSDETTSDAWLRLSPYVFVYYERTEGTAPEDGAIAVKVGGEASALTGNDLMSGGLTFGNFKKGKNVQVFSFRMFNGTGDNPPAGLVDKTENTGGADGTYTFSVTWTYGGVNKEATASAYTYTHVAEGANG